MTPEWLTAIGTIGTCFVIGATAVAALIQVNHMRAGNRLDAFLALDEHFRDPDLQAALVYVQSELRRNLDHSTYREELSHRGFIDPQSHPELLLCNWFNKMGILVRHEVVGEDVFMDMFARLISYYWELLSPAIVLMRRTRGSGEYHSFEYIACRAQDWLALKGCGQFPKGVARQKLHDPWPGDSPLPKIAHKVRG
jgi:hypothetical protein